jgi:hypothetical protein
MAHNGKRVHGNFWFLDSGREFPFMNVLKMCRNWYSTTINAWITPDMLSAQGYPISLAGMTGMQCSVGFPSQSRRPGNYVFKWEGYGNFTLNLGATVVSGSLNATDGRVVFTPTGTVSVDGSQGIQLQVRGINYPASPLSNLVICHEDDEEALDNGSIFAQAFLDKVSNFGSLRFIDWQCVMHSAVTKWEHRKPVDYWSYVADEARTSLYAGVTSRSGSDYTASLPGFVLEDKAVVMITFNETGPATLATIDIESTGQKNILGAYGATTLGSNFTAGSTACLVFDEMLDGYITFGGQANYSIGMAYLRNYCPVEVMVELCNQVGAHPWLHVNYLALDPLTDYAAELATYCLNNLDEGLIPRFEPSNEVWNSAFGFWPTRYAWAKATVRWPTSSFDSGNWYGMVVSTMGEAIGNVYNNDRTKYCMINATQAGVGGVVSINRMESPRWVNESGGDPAYEHATHWSMATYWQSRYCDGGGRVTTTELELAYQYRDGDAAAKAAALDAYIVLRADGDINSNGGQGSISDLMESASAFAASYGLGLLYYEGGFSPDELGGNVSRSITGVTKSGAGQTNTVLQMATGNVNGMQTAGESVTISGVVGMTELNGNTYTITSIDDTLGRMTIDVDSSGFTNYTSGGSAVYIGSQTAVNTMRRAGKWEDSIYDIELLMLNQSQANGDFPACYMLCGANSPYSVFDPTIWDDPTPRWQAILDFNAAGEPESEPTFNLPRGGGSNRNKKKERRYVLEMDNKMYQVSSLEEARAILQSQPKIQKKSKTLKLPKLTIELGEVSRVKVKNVPLVKALTMNVPLDWIEDAIQRMEDDEEEAVLLLLH